jgi:hypothetical protein
VFALFGNFVTEYIVSTAHDESLECDGEMFRWVCQCRRNTVDRWCALDAEQGGHGPGEKVKEGSAEALGPDGGDEVIGILVAAIDGAAREVAPSDDRAKRESVEADGVRFVNPRREDPCVIFL